MCNDKAACKLYTLQWIDITVPDTAFYNQNYNSNNVMKRRLLI